MKSRSLLAMIMLVTVLGLALGCSGGSDPVAPPAGTPLTSERAIDASSGRALWSMWQVAIDSTTGEVETVPLRGPAFNCNVTQFLHPPWSPVNQMHILLLPSSDLPGGYVELDITFNHPFPGMNQFSGFDVRGIFMADGSQTSDHDPNLAYGDGELNEAHMLNPDGYTRWWNATEFTDPSPLFSFKPGPMGNHPNPTATLNPYKYYADDLGYDADVADMDTSNRGVFTPDGPTHKRHYKIQFPVVDDNPVYLFSYAVDASWEPPDPAGAPDYPLDSFGPSAQCQEAYHLGVNTLGSTVWYEGGDSGGDLHITLEVFDWQGAASSTGVPGEISAIWIESPILATPVDIFPLATPSAGSQTTSSVFDVDLGGGYLSLSSPGEFPMLIGVESSEPNTYQPQLDGGESFIFPDAPLTAYLMGTCTVDGEQPFEPADDVTGDVILSIDRNSSETITGVTLDWTGNGSPFYAVYTDDNPYDGLEATIYVAEFTDSVAMIDIVTWPDFSSNGAYAFGVKGRSVSGLPASDSPNMSQLAFCEMEDFDGGSNPVPWIEGYRDVDYQWIEANPGLIDGSTSIRSDPVCPISQWAVIVSEVIPEIPDSEMSFMEFAHIASFYSWLAYYKQLSAGFTHSVPPTGTPQYLDYDSTTDFYCIMDGTHNWVMPAGPPPGGGWIGLVQRFGWNPGYNFFGWRFADCPHGTAKITRMAFPHFIDDAGTIRAGMAWVTNTWDNPNDWMEVDEIAVVIY